MLWLDRHDFFVPDQTLWGVPTNTGKWWRQERLEMRYRQAAWWLFVFGMIAATSWLAAFQFSPRPSISSGMLLFKDDFSNPLSGWDTWRSDDSSVNYRSGGLRVAVDQAQTDVWSRPKINYQDVRIEVDAVKVSGPEQNDFGLICRYQDDENYYALVVGSDGSAGIMKVKGGEVVLLNAAGAAAARAIHPGSELNHLRADCIGPRLILSANGRKLVEARDHDFSSGGVGVMAGTFETPGVELLFDDFLVYNP
jgi:hypothetical protein